MKKTKAAYAKFLKTPFWDELRNQCFMRDGRKCTHCQSTFEIQAHHKIYRKDWLKTKLEDLVTLCRKCHTAIHENPPKPKKSKLENTLNPKDFILRLKIKPKGVRKWIRRQNRLRKENEWSF